MALKHPALAPADHCDARRPLSRDNIKIKIKIKIKINSNSNGNGSGNSNSNSNSNSALSFRTEGEESCFCF